MLGEKELNKIMRKMCTYVKVKWKDINPKEIGWFNKYSWTIKQQDKFRTWMINYLLTDKDAQKILSKQTKSKKLISDSVDWFIFDYGWKITRKMPLIKSEGIEGYYMKDIKKELNKEEYKNFLNFMRGQTIAVINDEELVYKWDYDRYEVRL